MLHDYILSILTTAKKKQNSEIIKECEYLRQTMINYWLDLCLTMGNTPSFYNEYISLSVHILERYLISFDELSFSYAYKKTNELRKIKTNTQTIHMTDNKESIIHHIDYLITICHINNLSFLQAYNMYCAELFDSNPILFDNKIGKLYKKEFTNKVIRIKKLSVPILSYLCKYKTNLRIWDVFGEYISYQRQNFEHSFNDKNSSYDFLNQNINTPASVTTIKNNTEKNTNTELENYSSSQEYSNLTPILLPYFFENVSCLIDNSAISHNRKLYIMIKNLFLIGVSPRICEWIISDNTNEINTTKIKQLLKKQYNQKSIIYKKITQKNFLYSEVCSHINNLYIFSKDFISNISNKEYKKSQIIQNLNDNIYTKSNSNININILLIVYLFTLLDINYKPAHHSHSITILPNSQQKYYLAPHSIINYLRFYNSISIIKQILLDLFELSNNHLLQKLLPNIVASLIKITDGKHSEENKLKIFLKLHQDYWYDILILLTPKEFTLKHLFKKQSLLSNELIKNYLNTNNNDAIISINNATILNQEEKKTSPKPDVIDHIYVINENITWNNIEAIDFLDKTIYQKDLILKVNTNLKNQTKYHTTPLSQPFSQDNYLNNSLDKDKDNYNKLHSLNYKNIKHTNTLYIRPSSLSWCERMELLYQVIFKECQISYCNISNIVTDKTNLSNKTLLQPQKLSLENIIANEPIILTNIAKKIEKHGITHRNLSIIVNLNKNNVSSIPSILNIIPKQHCIKFMLDTLLFTANNIKWKNHPCLKEFIDECVANTNTNTKTYSSQYTSANSALDNNYGKSFENIIASLWPQYFIAQRITEESPNKTDFAKITDDFYKYQNICLRATKQILFNIALTAIDILLGEEFYLSNLSDTSEANIIKGLTECTEITIENNIHQYILHKMASICIYKLLHNLSKNIYTSTSHTVTDQQLATVDLFDIIKLAFLEHNKRIEMSTLESNDENYSTSKYAKVFSV